MSKYFFILKKIVYFWNNENKFNSFINILTLLISVLCITIIIITSFINLGFKNNAIDKIVLIDGVSRYYKKDFSPIHDADYFNIDKILTSKSNTLKLSKVLSHEGILKSKGLSEGVMIKSIDDKGIDVFNLKKFLIEGVFEDNSIIIGKKLSIKLNLLVNDYATILKIEDNSFTDIKLINVRISGIYETNIPLIDEHSIYGKHILFDDFFNLSESGYSTIVSQDPNYYKFNNDYYDINTELYYSQNYKQRHSDFLGWLNAYDAPIKILLFFVFIINFINISSYTFIDINNRKHDICNLHILGFSKNILRNIFVLRNIIIMMLSIFCATFLSFILLFIQEQYNFIKIPNDIYFINKLPIAFDSTYYFIIIILLILYTLFFSIYSLSSILNNSKINY